MARVKTVPDEQIIAALLQHGTIKGAAAAAGLSERAIYDRMNNGDFQALYKAAKADLIRSAVFNIHAQLQAAIDTIVDVMTDANNNPAIRLQAARIILNNAGKFAAQLQADENSVIAQVDSNSFVAW